MAEKVLVHSVLNRLFHWMFAASVITLLATGFYIHHPVDLGKLYHMETDIFMQIAVGFFAAGVFFSLIYYYIVTRSYRNIWVHTRDIADFWGLLKYYFFIEKTPPHYGKYNSGQKLIYSSWFIVFIFMFFSGLILYTANFGDILPFPVVYQKIRFYHFLGALWFLGTVPLHIYLVLTQDPAKLQAIFTGWVKK